MNNLRRFALITLVVLAIALVAGFLLRSRPVEAKGSGPLPVVSASVLDESEGQNAWPAQAADQPKSESAIFRSAREPPPPVTTDADAARAPEFETLRVYQSPLDADGRFERIRIVRTDFKYPLQRVVETVARDPATGQETVLRKTVMVADHILVKLKPGSDVSDLEKLNAKYGTRIRRAMHTAGLYLVQIEGNDPHALTKAIEQYNSEAAVISYAEPDYIVQTQLTLPDDPRFGELWGLHNTGQTGGTPDADIDAPEAWDITTGSTNVVVAVIDSGVDFSHADLSPNQWLNPGEIPNDSLDNDNNGFVDDINGWDFANGDNNPFDDHSHGSHVAGTIAAAGNNSLGVVGVSWSAKIMALKFLTAGGTGAHSDAIDAINYATMMRRDRGINVRLSNNSWGGGGFSQAMVDAIGAHGEAGLLFMAAAGNSANDNDVDPHYPSSFTNENIIAVAAVNHFDQMASFSSYGFNSVDLAAPGVGILSTVPGANYALFNGTSMATPHVAGVAALVWSINPDATYQQVRDALLNGVDVVPSLSGLVRTGGRLNARETLLKLGMIVIESAPANSEVVFSPPSAFAVTFNFPYDTGTVSAADLTVDGIPADHAMLTSSNAITFSFDASPITNEGLHVMAIASNAIARAGDSEGNKPWNASFRYDTLAMEVVQTIPTNGAHVTIPFTTLVVVLNEPYDPASVQIADLTLEHGAVTGFDFISSNAMAFHVSGIINEGLLGISIRAGALADQFGNPNLAYAGSFIMDIGETLLPTPLTPLRPPGSLIHKASASAVIQPAADEDAFTIELDAGQTIAITVTPGASLQPRIVLRDPADSIIADVTAPAAGAVALVSSAPVAGAGNYSITVSGLAGTTGHYDMAMLLNAAFENEAPGGTNNDARAAAQDLAATFTSLGGPAMRGAVHGGLGGGDVTIIFEEDFESGLNGFVISNSFGSGSGLWHLTGGRGFDAGHSPTTSIYYGKDENGSGGGNYNTGAANGGAFYSPPINLPGAEKITLRFNHFLQTENDPEWDVVEVAVIAGTNVTTIATSINGSLPTGTGGEWKPIQADLTPFAGSNIVLRFSFDTLDNIANNFEGWYVDDIAIETPVEQVDWYRFTLMTGESASLMLTRISPGAAHLQLYDAEAALLASGLPGFRNVHEVISGYKASSNGIYYARVTGFDADYTLVLTRNAAFDLEPNNERAQAQQLNGATRALGAIKSVGSLFGIEWRSPTPMDVLGLDPATAAILNRFPSPVTPVSNPFGMNLAYDGQNLWYNDGANFGNNAIYKLDAATGALLASFDPDVPRFMSLAWLNNELFGTDGSKIYVFDDATFALKRTLSPAWLGGITGLAGDPSRNMLWAVSQSTHAIYLVNPQTGESLIQGTSQNEGAEQDLAIVGDELFISETTGLGLLNDIAVYNMTTMFPVRRMPVSVSTMICGLGGDGVAGIADDWYRFEALAGSPLQIQTATPAGEPDHPLEFANALNPALELFNPSGVLVAADDNSAPDGKNALVSHLTETSGLFAVRVYGVSNSEGAYVLSLSGVQTSPAPFAVTSTVPAAGAHLINPPATMTVYFNDAVLLPTLQASDLTFNGQPATGFTMLDGAAVSFGVPALGEGTTLVAIASDALRDVQNTPVQPYSAQLIIDQTPPRVTAHTIAQGGTVPTGAVALAMQFSERLAASAANATNVILNGLLNGIQTPSLITYNPTSSILDLQYTNLPDDLYSLTLLSGPGLVRDLAGNLLDGETNPDLPSGDGIAGGDYVLHFFCDAGTTHYPVPLEAKLPHGSLVYDPSVSAYIISAGDQDRFSAPLDAGQLVTIAVEPHHLLRPTVTLAGPSGTVSSATASAPGQSAVIQAVPLSYGANFTVTVFGAASSTGAFTARLLLNAAMELESVRIGTNDSLTSAQNINGSFMTLPASAQRGAVRGRAEGSAGDCLGPDGFNYRACSVAFDFEDISTSGVPIMVGIDDDFVELTPANLAGFSFAFYGTTHSNLFIDSNGLLTFNSGTFAFNNTDLTASPTQPAIAPLWDDLIIQGATNSAIFWEIRGPSNDRRLIIQWNNVSFYQGAGLGQITFQVVLFARDQTIHFNYADLDSAHAGNGGASATVGIKDAGAQGSRRILISHNSGSNSFVGTGKSIRIGVGVAPGVSPDDFYSFSLTGGDNVTIALTADKGTNVELRLFNPAGALVAAGSNDASNVTRAIRNWVAPATGLYAARIRGLLDTRYTLMVLRNAVFDREPNDTAAQARFIGDIGVGLGALTGNAPSADVDVYSLYAVPGNVLSISTWTPGDGPREFVNTLDPRLELYDPGNNLVAADDNSAGDGRNAQLGHMASTNGLFTIRVIAASGRGEYILVTPALGGQPTLSFAADTFIAQENAGAAVITVHRAGTTNIAVAVNYSTSNGTAIAGSDYTAATGTLFFSVGQQAATFSIPLAGGDGVEPHETVHLRLSNPTAGAVLGSPGNALLVIRDESSQPLIHLVPGAPIISADPDTQNNVGDNFDLNQAGSYASTVNQGGFGDFGRVFANYDATNFYIGGYGSSIAGLNNGMIIFLSFNTLGSGVGDLTGMSGPPDSLDLMHNLSFVPGMNIAIVLGDEWGDGTYSNFNLGNGYDFGQGVFHLGPTTFPAVAGARLSQFDGATTNATVGTDDDGNRLTDRWEASIPWSSLGAVNVGSITSCYIAGVFASDGVSGNNRYISGNFLGAWAASPAPRDGFNNFAFNAVTLFGLKVVLPGSDMDSDFDGMPDDWELLHFGGITNAVAGIDEDLDGASNRDEYIADTDPKNSNSFFRIVSFQMAGTSRVFFASSTGRLYHLSANTNLFNALSWSLIQSNVWGTGGVMSLADTNRPPLRHYRLHVQLP